MNKFKYLAIIFGTLLLTPFTVKADCDYERLAELSRIASNIQFSYTYTADENGEPHFNIDIVNLTNDIYIEDNSVFKRYISGTGERQVSYSAGSSIDFDIYSNDPNCRGELLLTQYVNLPQFNYYSTSENCQKYPDFKYCQIWSNTVVNETTFNNELKQYQSQSSDKTVEEKKDFWEILAQFYEDNKLSINAVIVGISVLIIYLIFRLIKRRK